MTPTTSPRTGAYAVRIAVALGIVAFLVVSSIVAYGFRIDYLLREQSTLAFMASGVSTQFESMKLVEDVSYDFRSPLIGSTVLEFRVQARDRDDEETIRNIIIDEFDKVRPYLRRVDLRIIFEVVEPEADDLTDPRPSASAVTALNC